MGTVFGTISRLDAPAAQAAHEAGEDGQIVVVRPQVVENIGHVLGNLFQRIYHLVERSRETDAVTAADLESSTRRLEDFLQLVMDYVSPLALSYQEVSGTDVVQSLARQLSETVGCPVRVDARMPVEVRLFVDAGRLARAFALLATQIPPARDAGLDLKAAARVGGRSLSITAVIPARLMVPRTSEAEMQWAVAEKLLEIQGGALQQTAALGEMQWVITLPLQS